MTALATIQTDITPAFQAWLDTGRQLLTQRNDLDWRLADWLETGRETFVNQAGFDFLADQLGIAPRRLKAAAATARAFPVHVRDTSLTIEHHAGVASLPVQEALPLLKQAKERHWTPEQTKVEAVRLKASGGYDRGPADDDGELASFLRHWNRLPRTVRIEAAELIADAKGELIEP